MHTAKALLLPKSCNLPGPTSVACNCTWSNCANRAKTPASRHSTAA